MGIPNQEGSHALGTAVLLRLPVYNEHLTLAIAIRKCCNLFRRVGGALLPSAGAAATRSGAKIRLTANQGRGTTDCVTPGSSGRGSVGARRMARPCALGSEGRHSGRGQQTQCAYAARTIGKGSPFPHTGVSEHLIDHHGLSQRYGGSILLPRSRRHSGPVDIRDDYAAPVGRQGLPAHDPTREAVDYHRGVSKLGWSGQVKSVTYVQSGAAGESQCTGSGFLGKRSR